MYSLTYVIVVRDFGFTLDDVNWLGNIIACVYLPSAILTPIITKRYGIRNTVCPLSHIPRCNLTFFIQCHLATFSLLLSAWVRYAGTGRSLPKHGAYALVIIGQVRTPSSTLFYFAFTSVSPGTFWLLPTSIPNPSTKIFRKVV